MKPAAFSYFRPGSVSEATELLREHGNGAAVLAGGQSLVPLMNARAVRPDCLIDVNRLESLDYLHSGALGSRSDSDSSSDDLVPRPLQIRIGALTRHATIERAGERGGVRGMLGKAASHIGPTPVRARGTFGGSLSNADPAAELPLVALTLDAEIVAESVGGRRALSAEAFFHGPGSTALRADELLIEARIRVPDGAAAAFEELGRRKGGVAICAVCAAIAVEDGRCAWARIGLGAIAGTPVRSRDAERVMVGAPPSGTVIEEAGEAAAREFEPPADIHASDGFRRRQIAILVRRALSHAASETNT